MKKTMNEILATVAAPVSSIENWVMPNRYQLTTKFEATERGRPRGFDRRNTLELALISGFRKANATASAAVAMAAAVLRADKAKSKIWEFWVFVDGDITKGKQIDILTVDILNALPPVWTVVHVGEIVRRVDKLFEGD